MTTTPEPSAALTLPFPEPGQLLLEAYDDLYLADEGDSEQREEVGDSDLLPRPWDPPTCRDPHLRGELWEWLDAVVTWFNHEYVWDPASMIPPCWPHHPHLIHEIAVLADQRRRAGLALNSNALEEWHRYTVPGFTDRMRARLKAHCDQDHQPWPARSRQVRHVDDRHHRQRQDLFSEDVETLGSREPIVRTRPSLAVVVDRPEVR